MQTITDTLLSKFDSTVRKLGPVNELIDKVVSRVAPTVEAKAACGTGEPFCGVQWCYAGDGCPGGYYMNKLVYGPNGCGNAPLDYCYVCAPFCL